MPQELQLLVCSGGSEFADAALQMTGELARGLAASVTVLTVRDPRHAVNTAQIQDRSKKILSQSHVPIHFKTRTGHPATEILNESAQGYHLVALGSHGARGITEFFLGDTTVQVVEHHRISTLVVRRPGAIRRILVCVRLGRENPELIQAAGEFAKAFKCPVTLLYVVPIPGMYGFHVRSPLELAERRPGEGAHLKRIAEQLNRDYGVSSELRIREGVPEEEILRESQDTETDLIVVGASSWRGLSGVLLGNFSYTIAKHAQTSVLIVAATPDARPDNEPAAT